MPQMENRDKVMKVNNGDDQGGRGHENDVNGETSASTASNVITSSSSCSNLPGDEQKLQQADVEINDDQQKAKLEYDETKDQSASLDYQESSDLIKFNLAFFRTMADRFIENFI